ncbi:hypothetical protein C7Y66_14435 [Chroococcidiopsis sp. CCALA 051]|uniref:hypothetical protein n=1 Tax=Chroococcidiopsis sp. CCALA 051 TaxID=869949 RepID=UPI000D0D2FA4|nr:hypothetical protein [Chroococcidiopsis sp. CCALA 051]PSM48419.1 hypothetical protein C7Y66_14435 [Chroococcidiopsis sp. CCALA 051]
MTDINFNNRTNCWDALVGEEIIGIETQSFPTYEEASAWIVSRCETYPWQTCGLAYDKRMNIWDAWADADAWSFPSLQEANDWINSRTNLPSY